MDIKTAFNNGIFDWKLDWFELAVDSGLETAVSLSLFTDRYDPAAPREDRRGWWGDVFRPNDHIGSRLWRLEGAPLNAETFNRARDYALEALQWLIEDGVAQAVDVQASGHGSALLLEVQVQLPDETAHVRYVVTE